MTAFTLVWGALTRRKLRTLFTFLSVVVTFTLFCVLAAIQQGMSGQLTIASAQRLRTHVMASRTSGPLPLSYLDKIASVPGVTAVTYDIDAIHGYFRDPKNSVRVIAFAGQAFMQVYPEFHLTPEEKYSWLSDRQGAIVGPVLARRMGWKVGDTIPIQGGPAHEDGSTTWYFHLDGIYSSELPSAYQGFFVTHYKYFDEGMANDTNKDRVFEFIERVDDPRNSARISNDIDQLFENASPQTLTQSEQLESISNVRQFGDITRMVIYVGLAVFFTLLLVIGNNMAQSVQERIREFALFRTLRFSRLSLGLLILQESLLLVSAGGTAGLLLGYALTRYLYPDLGNVLQTFGMTWNAVAIGIVLAAAFGTLAALIPAQRVVRLRVAEALGKA